LAALLAEDHTVTPETSAGCFGRLGYSGFLVASRSQADLPDNTYIFNGVININDAFYPNFIDRSSVVELFLLQTAAKALTDQEKSYIQSQITTNIDRGVNWAVDAFRTLTVPAFNPIKWNNWDVMPRNNCYNYANDKVTNSFAQPGRGSGHGMTEISCKAVTAASISDGLTSVDKSAIPAPPNEGHFICSVVWPGRDYHWYRLDRTGIWSEQNMWSHKPGQTWAKNWDASGRPIWDPEDCDYSPYSEFCGYFHCIPAGTTIK